VSKHTKGPWEWVEDRLNGGYSGLVGANGEEVLFPNCRNDGDEGAAWFEDFPSEADRNLIAAAPELLEALKIAIERLDDGSAWSDEHLYELEAVVAKAEGGPAE
jgi:hypothetical protein